MLDTPRTILLTGGTSGIGAALADQLVAGGHQLVILARSADKLQALAQRHPGLVTHTCDMSRREDIEAAVKDLFVDHPEISVIINNAGMQVEGSIIDADLPLDSVETEMATNFLGPVWLIAACLPYLRAKDERSAIVNVSSGLAIYPKTGSATYCASKAALHSFTQSLRYQLEGSSVHVFEAIVPLVDTPMTEGRGSGKISAAECARQMINGLQREQAEIYIGRARLLPVLSRVAPGPGKKILKGTG